MSDIDEGPLGVWVLEMTWDEICARYGLRCQNCKDFPTVHEIDVFADEGICGYCAAFERKLAGE